MAVASHAQSAEMDFEDGIAEAKQKGIEIVKPLSEDYPYSAGGPRQSPSNKVTYDWIVYSRVECASNWNQFCSGGFKLEAPAKWQVCNPLFTVEVQKNDGNYYVVPKDWYPNTTT